jgi:hypothetical protein
VPAVLDVTPAVLTIEPPTLVVPALLAALLLPAPPVVVDLRSVHPSYNQ